MSESRDKLRSAEAPPGAVDPAAGAGESRPRPNLKALWPPALLAAAMVLFAGGLVAALMSRPAPDPAIPLDHARELVEHQEFEAAIEHLNKEVLAFIDSGKATRGQLREFHLIRARAFAGAQSALGIGRAENHRVVIDDLLKAESIGKPEGEQLLAEDVGRLAHALLATDQTDKALERIRALPDSESARRTRLFKEVVLKNLGAENRREELTIELLATLAVSPDLAPEDRVWVLARQAELLIAAGRVEDAVTKLLRDIQRLRDVPPEAQGELYVLLGRAYFEMGQPADAARQLEAADALLGRASELRADAAVLLGRIALAEAPGDNAEERLVAARERFTSVMTDFSGSRAYLPALLGLAETEAALEDDDAAVERYAELVEAIRKNKSRSGVTRDEALASLMRRHRSLFERARSDAARRKAALRYAELAESLFDRKDVPAPVLLALGRTSRELADAAVEAARTGDPADFSVDDLDPATRAEVKLHYLAAGEYYRSHAQSVSATDTDAYSQSLWTAADSYDRAGDLEEAHKAFALYADGAPDTDPNKPASRFRLAQIFQAQGDYSAAQAIYSQLMSARAADGGAPAAGSWSDQSIVPLARCLLADSDPANDAQAESLLLSVVESGLMTPDARDYREALVQLGGTYYAAGRYPEAIARLEQAVDRYPDHPDADSIRFRLADSHRLGAGAIAADLRQAKPQDEREELERQRLEHLRTAMALYDQVRLDLEGAGHLGELEALYLRNACFYIGDCAFELGDFDRAIAAYDAARLKYADDPSSLVAMVQIVSAYVAQEKFPQARTANERARQQLARFPDSVWSRPDLPMEKKHWERWLDARTLLDQTARAPE